MSLAAVAGTGAATRVRRNRGARPFDGSRRVRELCETRIRLWRPDGARRVRRRAACIPAVGQQRRHRRGNMRSVRKSPTLVDAPQPYPVDQIARVIQFLPRRVECRGGDVAITIIRHVSRETAVEYPSSSGRRGQSTASSGLRAVERSHVSTTADGRLVALKLLVAFTHLGGH